MILILEKVTVFTFVGYLSVIIVLINNKMRSFSSFGLLKMGLLSFIDLKASIS